MNGAFVTSVSRAFSPYPLGGGVFTRHVVCTTDRHLIRQLSDKAVVIVSLPSNG